MIRKNERAGYLLNILRRTGQISVTEAAEMLGVSGATVRRLFVSMEQEGLAMRSHGMLRPVPVGSRYSFEASAHVYSREKQSVGRMAAMFVEDGDTIYLDCGTTVFQMTLALAQRIARFTSKDGSKDAILKYCAKDSPVRTKFNDLSNTYATPHSDIAFQNESVTEFYAISDDCFTCHVTFDYLMKTKAGVKTDHTTYTFCVVKQGGSGKLYNLLMM